MWRSLLACTGDPEPASEAEAEALSQALRRGDELDDPAARIWRSAYRIAAGLLTKRNRRAISVASPPDQVVVADPLVEILSMFDDLAPQQRAIIALRYLGDLKPSAIAEILDTTPGSVRVQLHRAHALLRQQWSEL